MQRFVGGSWRHWVLKACLLSIALVFCARLLNIQIFRHDYFQRRAEIQWRSPIDLAPERGNLYDRHGRPLALSVKTWRIGVSTQKLDRAQQAVVTLAELLELPADAIRSRLQAAAGRHVVLAQHAVLSPAELDRLREYESVTLDDLRSRIYPLGGIGASLIGHFRSGEGQGPDITTGLEQSLAFYLAGQTGKAWRLESPMPDESLGTIVLQEAVHGRNVLLTLDADLQEICERVLARSVVRYGAKGGSILIVEPACGDILAAASYPLLADRSQRCSDPAVWNNCNFTGQYEPGSVFKIFTAASLLANGAIDTATVYDCDDSDFGRFTIRNSDGHSFEMLSFMEAFSQSCNVYFARAVGNLSPEEFYRDLTEFGFGQRTRFPYQAQAAGILKPPADWSGRSQSTIAIGQEVAVTPLQLAMAVSAVANGGILYAPRIVRQIHDREGRVIENCPPIPLHRVVSEALAALLREAMARVVSEGTGEGAALPWIRTGGKTGTAQKCLDGHGYARGKYVASFAGCVPSDRPRLVILAVVDEASGVNHYAAQSAVPMFRDVVTEIRRTTDWLTGVCNEATGVGAGSTVARSVTVPDVMYLSTALATAELRRVGLSVGGGDKEGCVVGQLPGPGALIISGGQVRITVAARRHASAEAGPACPDMHGLSYREVRNIAARLGVNIEIEGVGYVAAQQPPAGSSLGSAGIRVRMVAPWL